MKGQKVDAVNAKWEIREVRPNGKREIDEIGKEERKK